MRYIDSLLIGTANSTSLDMKNAEVALFKSGVHSLLDDENIPNDAASDEKNWYTHHGNIKLIPGRVLVGAEGASGAIYGEIFGYKVNGTKVHYRKTSTEIQYFDGTTWHNLSGDSQIELTGIATEVITWAERKMFEERRLKELAATNPTLKDAVEALQRAEEQVKIVAALVQQ